MFFSLSKLLFSGFLQFKGNLEFVQNTLKYRDRTRLIVIAAANYMYIRTRTVLVNMWHFPVLIQVQKSVTRVQGCGRVRIGELQQQYLNYPKNS